MADLIISHMCSIFFAHAANGPGGSWGIDRGLHEMTKTECPPPCIQRQDLEICNDNKKCSKNSRNCINSSNNSNINDNVNSNLNNNDDNGPKP